MATVTDHKYQTMRGSFAIRKRGVGNYREMGNVADAELTMNIDYVTLESADDDRGTEAKEETKRTVMLKLTANSQATEAFRRYVHSKASVIQAAAADQTFELPAGEAGDVIKLPHANISNAVITGKTEGTDYIVKPKTGSITYKSTFAAGIDVDYDAGPAISYGVMTDDNPEYEVLFTSESQGRVFEFMRLQLSPAATLKLIDPNNIGAFQMEGELLKAEGIPAHPEYGKFVKVTEWTPAD